VKKTKTGQEISISLERNKALEIKTAIPFNDDNHTRRNINSNNTTSITQNPTFTNKTLSEQHKTLTDVFSQEKRFFNTRDCRVNDEGKFEYKQENTRKYLENKNILL